jgi:hypothetical protein
MGLNTLNELKEQLQSNLITYLSDHLPEQEMDFVCDIVVSTFNGVATAGHYFAEDAQ